MQARGSKPSQILHQRAKSKNGKIRRKKIGEEELCESESYQPEFNQAKKLGLELSKDRIATGSWTLEETKLYLKFMLEHKYNFQTQKNRRKRKIFNQLSRVLRKRTPDQCRSHHQKLQLKCSDNFEQMIDHVRKKIILKENEETDKMRNQMSGKQMQNIRMTGVCESYDDEEDGLAIDFQDLAEW